MAATIYAPPEELGNPPEIEDAMKDGRFDYKEYDRLTNEWIEKLRAWVKANSRNVRSPLVGYVWRYPIADGYAQYMVFESSPLTLIHLPIGDAWDIPAVVQRGLRLSDIKQSKSFDDAWARAAEQKSA